MSSKPSIPKPDFRFKVVLVGDAGVGKSSLIIRLVRNKFYGGVWRENCQGEGCKVHCMNVDDNVVELRILGTDGQERFVPLPAIFYRHTQGAIVVFDVTNKRSFDNLQFWLDELKNKVGHDIPLVLVGNKIELEEKRVVDYATAASFSEQVGIPYMETSAEKGKGVVEAFSLLASRMVEGGNQNAEDDLDSDPTPTYSWCAV